MLNNISLKELITTRAFDYNKKKEIQKIVEEFLRKKKRIVYGGQAIDFALRLKGDKLYEDYTIPDYDFYSAKFDKDAYDLLLIFMDNGFNEVSIINAIHPSTLRIRVDSIYAADITFIPKSIYKKIKQNVLEFDGIYFRHPLHQLIDIYLSFSFPYFGKPQENIVHRWEKDWLRKNLIFKYYTYSNNDSTYFFNEKKKEQKILDNTLIGGICALKIYNNNYKIANNFIQFESEESFPLIYYINNDYLEKLQIDNMKHYNSFMHNIIPESYYDENNNILYLIINKSISEISYNNINNINIICIEHIIVYLLKIYFFDNNKILQYLQKALELNKKILPSVETFGSGLSDLSDIDRTERPKEIHWSKNNDNILKFEKFTYSKNSKIFNFEGDIII